MTSESPTPLEKVKNAILNKINSLIDAHNEDEDAHNLGDINDEINDINELLMWILEQDVVLNDDSENRLENLLSEE